MICKECGAYNPDHATYCKVCAASLKGDTTEQKPAVPEENVQPTRRFSRPSWVVPEQTKPEPEKIEKKPVRKTEPEPEIEEEEPIRPTPVNEAEPMTEQPSEEEPEDEEEEQLWIPASKRKVRRAPVVQEEEEPEEEESEESEEPEEQDEEESYDEEEPDDVYNDEETLESDDDSYEYEPTPPKRKTNKKKGNTIFTVLLIAIIVVIVCILVAGGLFLLKMNGALKCSGSNASSLTSCSGATKTSTVSDPTEVPGNAEATPKANDPEQPNETDATLEELIGEDGTSMVRITVLVPAKATMTIAIPNPRMNDYVKTNNDDMAKLFALKIDDSAFYDEEPLDEATKVYQPKITIQTAQGEVYDVKCPSFTRNYTPLSITLTAPLANEDGTIMAAEGNKVHFEGKVNMDSGVKLTINGVETTVYAEGNFFYDYTLTGDAAETIKLVATKPYYVSTETEVRVDPYVFIPDAMVLEVNGDITTLRADKTGKLTVTGKTLPGATVYAVSDDSANVRCGTVNVDSEGNFSMQISMDTAFYGVSKITLNGSKEGAEDGSTTFMVSRSYASKDDFTSSYSKLKTYREVNASGKSAITIAELIAGQSVYANAYGIRVSAAVADVQTVDGVQLVKLTVLKTNETVYILNLSKEWKPADNIGKKYNIYGNFIGTYEETGCAYFIGWFAKSIK